MAQLQVGTKVRVIAGDHSGRLGTVRTYTHVGLDPVNAPTPALRANARRILKAGQDDLHLVDFTDREEDEPDPVSGPYQWFKFSELEVVQP